jgi:hypothetical protein
MTNITTIKSTPEVTLGIAPIFAAMVAKFRAIVDAQAPLGYQDETGFHTGVKPRGEEAFCPSER